MTAPRRSSGPGTDGARVHDGGTGEACSPQEQAADPFPLPFFRNITSSTPPWPGARPTRRGSMAWGQAWCTWSRCAPALWPATASSAARCASRLWRMVRGQPVTWAQGRQWGKEKKSHPKEAALTAKCQPPGETHLSLTESVCFLGSGPRPRSLQLHPHPTPHSSVHWELSSQPHCMSPGPQGGNGETKRGVWQSHAPSISEYLKHLPVWSPVGPAQLSNGHCFPNGPQGQKVCHQQHFYIWALLVPYHNDLPDSSENFNSTPFTI